MLDIFLNWLKDPLSGYKTYIAAAGLLFHGLWQITQGDVNAGSAEILAALATFGIRSAIDRQ